MSLNLDELFELHKEGKLALDQKAAIVAHFEMKIPRRELARAIMDVVGSAARRERRDQTEAMANATKEQLIEAAHKALEKYIRKAAAKHRNAKIREIERLHREKVRKTRRKNRPPAKRKPRTFARLVGNFARNLKKSWESRCCDETAEILADDEIMKSLREAEKDIKEGRTIGGDKLRGG